MRVVLNGREAEVGDGATVESVLAVLD
ncbi:MAG: hypothetical protein AVDCRST_MAG66-1123, partial [uncultured Pseudonocardia sp.]